MNGAKITVGEKAYHPNDASTELKNATAKRPTLEAAC